MLRQFLTGLLRLMIRLPKELFSLSGSCSNHRFQWLFPELWRSGMYSGTSFFRKMHSQKRACISGQQSVFRCGPLSVWRAGAVLCLTATGSYRICTCFPGQSDSYHNRFLCFRQLFRVLLPVQTQDWIGVPLGRHAPLGMPLSTQASIGRREEA